MDRMELKGRLTGIIEHDRKKKERGEEIVAWNIVDDILICVDSYIEKNYDRKK